MLWFLYNIKLCSTYCISYSLCISLRNWKLINQKVICLALDNYFGRCNILGIMRIAIQDIVLRKLASEFCRNIILPTGLECFMKYLRIDILFSMEKLHTPFTVLFGHPNSLLCGNLRYLTVRNRLSRKFTYLKKSTDRSS